MECSGRHFTFIGALLGRSRWSDLYRNAWRDRFDRLLKGFPGSAVCYYLLPNFFIRGLWKNHIRIKVCLDSRNTALHCYFAVARSAIPVENFSQATSVILLSMFILVNLALIRINSVSTNGDTIHYPRWNPYVGATLCIAILVIKSINLLAI